MHVAVRAIGAAIFCLAVARAAGAAEAAAPAPARPSTAQPNVHVLPALAIPGLGRQRTIRVYLPPGYAMGASRYPVLYLHDGQNLFDAATGFAGEWEVDESLNRLARTRHLELIAVGIDNGGEHRLQELTAWDNAKYGRAEGRAYMDFVVDVVKPYIDAHYRTLPDRAHTAIMGSSLGALISHYALMQYPGVFGKAGLFSPSYWYAPQIYSDAATRRLPADTLLYFYAGSSEDPDMVGNMLEMAGVLRQAGFPSGDLTIHVAAGARHNEAAWRAEFPRAVEWLFGAAH
jgi:predicted alpha/beta superfamily hydrolase